MTLDDCITILTEHNKWRRGKHPYDDSRTGFPFGSKTIGEAIDYAVERLKGLEK